MLAQSLYEFSFYGLKLNIKYLEKIEYPDNDIEHKELVLELVQNLIELNISP